MGGPLGPHDDEVSDDDGGAQPGAGPWGAAVVPASGAPCGAGATSDWSGTAPDGEGVDECASPMKRPRFAHPRVVGGNPSIAAGRHVFPVGVEDIEAGYDDGGGVTDLAN